MTSRRRWVEALLGLGLAHLVILVTLLVTAHNLGARDDLGYINGGKVFRASGTMWYHIPGLADLGLSPQNIGGQINLRNNEFALLERDFASVDQIDVEATLAPDAMLLVVLDRHGENTFWAVRFSTHAPVEGQPDGPETPFANALVRFDHSQVTQRVPLDALGVRLTPGAHTIQVALGGGVLRATVDGVAAEVPFDTRALRPRLALGSGENNVAVHRWAVSGRTPEGRADSYVEDFSLGRTIERSLRPLFGLATFFWFLLIVLPLAKVSLEARVSPVEVARHALLRPWPRLGFGAACLLPFMPMLLQWVLGGLFVVYVWFSLWDRLAAQGDRAWRVPSTDDAPTWRPWLVGAGALIVAGVLLWSASALRSGLLGTPASEPDTPAVLQDATAGQLALGQGRSLAPGSGDLPRGTLRFGVELREGEVLRVDLLRSAPPLTDVYQVDRSQEKDDESADAGPSLHDYEMQAVSLLLSADAGLPGNLRRLRSDRVHRSPFEGWTVPPGRHEVSIAFDAPHAVLSVDGVVRDWRADLEPLFRVGAVQFLALSERVTEVRGVTLGDTAPGVDGAQTRDVAAALLVLLGVLLAILGAALLAVRLLVPRSFGGPSAVALALRVARAFTLLLLWLGAWVAVRLGLIEPFDELSLLLAGIVATGHGAFNLAQLFRHTASAPPRWARLLRPIVATLVALIGFEASGHLFPDRRYNLMTPWHTGLAPRWYWVHDPMVLRLNPWFIDHRFKRNEVTADTGGTRRVAVFGGSQTYGWGIPSLDRMAFSDQLEVALHAQGRTDVSVVNAAFPGVKTGTGLRWFAGNLLRYRPDVVVINFVVNEFMNVDPWHVWSGETPNDRPLARTLGGALVRRLFGDVVDSHLGQIILADVYEVYEMEAYLRWWVALAQQHQIRVVFSIEPTNLYVETSGRTIMREETRIGAAQSIYRRLGAELGVPVYDVLPFFARDQENLWFYDTMHMSRLGHKVFARHLADVVAGVLPARARAQP